MSSGATLEKASLEGETSARPVAIRQGWFFNLALTITLLAALLYSAVYIAPKISGEPALQSVAPVLFGVLLPIATVLLLSVIERLLAPAGPRKPLKSWLVNLHITLFWFLIASLTITSARAAVDALAGHFGFKPGLLDLSFAHGEDLVLLVGSVWLSMIAGDFFFYWYHRAMHGSRILWQVHMVHHSDRELDASTVNRDGWLDAIVAAALITLPSTLVLKTQALDPWQLGWLTGLVSSAFVTFLTLSHMNIRFQAGRVSLLYCSPQVHRIHHSSLPQHWDKNFAFVFPLWDVIFGTYYAPARGEFPPTGVDGEEEITSFWQAQTFPLRKWARMLREWRRFRPKADVANVPAAAPVEQGKTYWWCTCGRSQSQPFCDGSHRGTKHLPLKYRPNETGFVRLCRCKNTQTPPFCQNSVQTCVFASPRTDISVSVS